MGAKPQPCYNRNRAINDRVIMRLQCILHLQNIQSFSFAANGLFFPSCNIWLKLNVIL